MEEGGEENVVTAVEPANLGAGLDDLPPPPTGEEKVMDELTAEERVKLLQRKEEREEEYFITMQKWGKVALYAMFFPAFLSIITIVCGVWVLNVASTACVVNLKSFVAAYVALSYFLLIFYTAALIGPWPMNNIMWYWGFGIPWCFICFIIGLVGTSFVASGSPCSATAPHLLAFSKYLVAIFWLGLIISSWYVGEELLLKWRARQAHNAMKARILAEREATEQAEADAARNELMRVAASQARGEEPEGHGDDGGEEVGDGDEE